MRENLSELWRFRYLLWQLVRRDLKVRYKNSRLGFLWSIAPPLMQVAVITFAFKYATNYAQGFQNYSAYVLAALIPWTYFQTTLLDSSQSILMMYGVIRKVYLPREVIPLAAVLSNTIHFLLSWAVFLPYLWIVLGAPVLKTTLLFPYLAFVLFMLVAALSLLVSALNVFYDDVKYIVQVLMGLGLFVLPIMYLVEQAVAGREGRWRPLFLALYEYNPLSVLITGFRKALLEPHPAEVLKVPVWPIDYAALGWTGLFSFALLTACYAYFNHRKWQFVERP